MTLVFRKNCGAFMRQKCLYCIKPFIPREYDAPLWYKCLEVFWKALYLFAVEMRNMKFKDDSTVYLQLTCFRVSR